MPSMTKKWLSEKLAVKTLDAGSFLCEELRNYQRPVTYLSFGKDSLVLLHLLIVHKIFLPVVSHASPFYPAKYTFARKVTLDANLLVFDYPPLRTSMVYGNGVPAIMEEFQTHPLNTIAVPKNIREFEDGDDPARFQCGVDLLTQPCGTFAYPWDVAIIGHKDCDSDSVFGEVPLHSDKVYRDAGPDLLFPLKEWSHQDIWDYLDAFEIEVQSDRYDREARKESDDKTYNPDWFEMCIRCVDKRKAGTKVFCPKLKLEIENQSEHVPEHTQKFDYFGVQK
jgi:hypothetical protein